MNSVLEKNIEKMTGDSAGEMMFLLSAESMGGNAGNYKNYPCAAANFYIDSSTGEIKYFGNIQNIPKNILRKFHSGNFRLAMDIKNTGKCRVVSHNLEKATRTAKSNLKRTINFYNKNYGFRF